MYMYTYGYSQVTHIDDEVTQCLHTHTVRSWVRFTKFGFPNGSTPHPHPTLKHMKTFVEKHEKYSCECCPWRCMSSGLAVSHFSLTTRHCEWAAFSFTMNTLRKCDCLEVKEVKSGCCVKKKGGGNERNGGGNENGRMLNWTRFGYHLWTWTLDAPCAALWSVCSLRLQHGSSGSAENQNHVLLLRSMKNIQTDKLLQELNNIGYHLHKQM